MVLAVLLVVVLVDKTKPRRHALRERTEAFRGVHGPRYGSLAAVTTLPGPPLPTTLQHYLTPERLGPYRAAVAGGSLEEALRLYRWNGLASAALFEVLGHLEVLLRNAMDQQLQAWHTGAGHPGDWWDDPRRILHPHARDDVAKARNQARGRPATHGRVLAELNFGFWRVLLARRYEATLWTPALRYAFPQLRPARRQLPADRVDRLHKLRNRIAHQEPIHHLDLAGRHDDAIVVAGYIDPTLAAWLRSTSRLPALLTRPPGGGT